MQGDAAAAAKKKCQRAVQPCTWFLVFLSVRIIVLDGSVSFCCTTPTTPSNALLCSCIYPEASFFEKSGVIRPKFLYSCQHFKEFTTFCLTLKMSRTPINFLPPLLNINYLMVENASARNAKFCSININRALIDADSSLIYGSEFMT